VPNSRLTPLAIVPSLQVVAQSIRLREDFSPVVWGYRNVWFRFHMSDSTVMIPVDDSGLDEMNDAFLTCFSTQKVRLSYPHGAA
jgi:glucosamine-6-phosphate deaminase